MVLLAALPVAYAVPPGDAGNRAGGDQELELLVWLFGLADWEAVVDEAGQLEGRGGCGAHCLEYYSIACLRLERFQQAQDALTRLRKMQPENRKVAGYLGFCQMEFARQAASEGRVAEAGRLYAEASALLGEASLAEDATERLLRAWAAALEGAGRLGELPAALRALMARNPGDVSVRLRLAQLQKDAGALDEARATLEAAPEFSEAIETLLFNVAVQFFRAGRLSETETITSALISRQPQYAAAYRLRGFARYRRDGIGPALADLRKFLELAPESPEADAIRAQIQDL